MSLMSPAVLFYIHIVLTGLTVVFAARHLAAMMGAPEMMLVPVARNHIGPGMAVILWVLSGPLALMRAGSLLLASGGLRSLLSLPPLLFALLWTFSLGVLTLELGFVLFGQ